MRIRICASDCFRSEGFTVKIDPDSLLKKDCGLNSYFDLGDLLWGTLMGILLSSDIKRQRVVLMKGLTRMKAGLLSQLCRRFFFSCSSAEPFDEFTQYYTSPFEALVLPRELIVVALNLLAFGIGLKPRSGRQLGNVSIIGVLTYLRRALHPALECHLRIIQNVLIRVRSRQSGSVSSLPTLLAHNIATLREGAINGVIFRYGGIRLPSLTSRFLLILRGSRLGPAREPHDVRRSVSLSVLSESDVDEDSWITFSVVSSSDRSGNELLVTSVTTGLSLCLLLQSLDSCLWYWVPDSLLSISYHHLRNKLDSCLSLSKLFYGSLSWKVARLHFLEGFSCNFSSISQIPWDNTRLLNGLVIRGSGIANS
ncbi:hypothetical protein Tco_0226112 [Tanacetum coccineum]